MSDDLPTPPLPDATAMTRQSRGRRMTLSRSVAPPRSLVVERLALLGCHDAEVEDEAADAVDVGEGGLDLPLEGVAERAAGDREDDRERDDPVGDLDVPDHVELRDGPPELGVDDARKGGEDRVAARFHRFERTGASSESRPAGHLARRLDFASP